MPYKDSEKERENAKLRQRAYLAKPGVKQRYAERMRKLRENPEFVARERAKQKVRMADPETRPARLAKIRAARAKDRQFFNLLKMERPCYDCGGMFPPEVTDWDHLPGKEKCFDIARYLTNKPREIVLAEIEKCQLVCSNCHRCRTSARKQEGKK